MIRSFELDKNCLKPVSKGNYHSCEVSYIYDDNEKTIANLKKKYNVKLDKIVKFNDEVAYDVINDNRGRKVLFISFLLPELTKGFHLDNLVTSIVILVLENKIIFVTKRKVEAIINLLTNFSLQNGNNFVVEITLKILETTFGLMINELRSLKKKLIN